MNNIVAFIPARSGSKSIPDKNVKLLGGKPLLVWTIDAAFEAGLSRVVVSTDSEQYAVLARLAGAEVLMRPAELAQDTTPMFEVLKSEIPKLDPQPELVMLLSPTVPFRKKLYIKMAITSLLSSTDRFDSLMSVEKVPDHFNPAQVLVNTPIGTRMADGRPVSRRLTRRQDYPPAYVTSQGIYLFKPENLKTGSFYGERVMLLECEPSIDINSPEDWEEAEKFINQKA